MATTLCSAGVDYITATSRQGGAQAPLFLVGRASIAAEAAAGNLERLWRAHEYEGGQCGAAIAAYGKQGTIVKLSGALAAERWRYLLRDADNVSRIDLQVTVRDDDQHCTRASIAYAQTQWARAEASRPWRAQLIVGVPDGQACYIGARSSDKYGRVYDKFAESKQPEYLNCWRYEVEYKHDVAKSIARQLAEQAKPNVAAAATVLDFFSARGVKHGLTVRTHALNDSQPRKRSDADTTLEWLRTQVRPAVDKLREQGYEDDAIRALGLRDDILREGCA